MQPEDVKNFERTLELGKLLTQDLSDDDVLGRWMAHHLGDLIVKAENTTEPEQLELRREAADLIIRLWTVRSGAPLDSSPTSAFEPIVNAFAVLAEHKPWRFYQMFPEGSEPDSDTTQTSLLRVALTLENAIRDVVRHIIVTAAKDAADREANWLQAAEHLADDSHQLLASFARRIDLRQLMDADALTTESDTPGPHARSISILRRTEKAIAEVRHALEELSDDSSDDT
ncbi:hypothetical protein ACWEF6_06935 [Amycolatopsis sp. NPDC004772]